MNKVLWGLVLYFIAGSVFAEAVMTITTSSTDVPVTRSGSTSSVVFNVLNSSTTTLTQLTVDPDFGVPSGVSGITTSADTCTGATLSPHGVCTFTVNIQGNTTLPNQFFLSPRVCAFNNSVCSQPAKADRPEVIVIRQVYVANAGGNSISVCEINSTNNQITACVNAFSGDPLDAPVGLMMTSDGKQVYVANSGNGVIALCTVSDDGTFSTCEGTGIVLASPSDVELNPAETFAYITYPSASTVIVCEVADDGTLNTCTSTANDLNGPSSIVFNNAGTIAYITNANNNTVLVCTADVTSGALSGCTSTGSGFSAPQSIDLNGNNKLSYIANYLSITNTISSCQISDLTTGVFSSCAVSNQNITNPFGLVLSPNNNILYVTQPSSNSIFKCNVNTGNGVLSDCGVTFSGIELSSPMGIVIN